MNLAGKSSEEGYGRNSRQKKMGNGLDQDP